MAPTDPFLDAAKKTETDPFLAAAQTTTFPSEISSSPTTGSESDPFLAAAKGSTSSASVPQKIESALGRGVEEAGRIVTGVASEFRKGLQPYDIKVVDNKVVLVDATNTINERRDKVRASINKFADEYLHASDADRQPQNIVERLAYGMIEFFPQAPVYSYFGGPMKGMVQDGLAAISEKFGPVISKQVAAKLPEYLQRAGKYVGEVMAHGIEAGSEAFGAELMAGEDMKKAMEQGGNFAVFSAAFKGLLYDPLAAGKRALWDAKGAPKAESSPSTEPATEELHSFNPFFRKAKEPRRQERDLYLSRGITQDDLSGLEASAKALEMGQSMEVGAWKLFPERRKYPLSAEELKQYHRIADAADDAPTIKEYMLPRVEQYLRENGYDAIGLQENSHKGDLYWFTDPKTGSTLLMPLERMTPQGIEKHVAESRAKFEANKSNEKLYSFPANVFNKQMDRWGAEDHMRVAVAAEHQTGKPIDPVGTFWDYALSKLEEKSPRAANYMSYSRQMAQHLRDYLDLDGIPALTRLGLANPAFDHGSAHLATPKIVDDMISRVMPDQYKDWRAKAAVMDLLVKDRILSGYDYNVKLRDESAAKAGALEGQIRAIQADVDFYTQEQGRGRMPRADFDRAVQGLVDRRNALISEKAQHEALAKEQHSIVQDIEKEHNVKQYELDVQKSIRQNFVEWKAKDQQPVRVDGLNAILDRWGREGQEGGVVTPFLDQLYREAKNLDPSIALDDTGTYGKYTRTRLSLIHKDSRNVPGTPKRPGAEIAEPSLDASTYAAPKAGADVSLDPHDRRAYFAGSYALGMEKNLWNTIEPRYDIVTKERFFKALEDRNAVQFGERPAGKLPEGVEWKQWLGGVKRPQSTLNAETGTYKTELVDTPMWVRSDVEAELRGVLNVDPNLKPMFFTNLATRIQLLQVVDFVSHAKNVLSEVSRAQGKGKGADIATRMPGFASVDAAYRINQVWRQVNADSPEIRSEIASLAKLGVLRPKHGEEGLLPTGYWLWKGDTASRVLMSRFYTQLVKEGKMVESAEGRRNFINQVGQYNDRFMQPWMRTMRRSGLSPFVVAGRTFNRNATRMLTGNAGGEQTETGSEEMKNLNMIGVALTAAVPMMINAWTTGSVFGRPGTPLFAVDLGTAQHDDGGHDVIDLGQLGGLARASREWGINRLYQGVLAGQTPEQVSEKVAGDVVLARTHPWTGPGVSTLLDSLGPTILRRAGFQIPGKTTTDIKTAATKINPMLAAPFGKAGEGWLEEKTAPESGERTLASRGASALDTVLSSPAGAFGYKEVKPTRTAAEEFIESHRQKFTSEDDTGMKQKKIRDKADSLYKKDPQEAMQYLQQKLDEGKIKLSFADRMARQFPLSKLQRGFDMMAAGKPGDTALETYRLANPKEKAQLFYLLVDKVERQRKQMRPEDFEPLHDFVQKAYEEMQGMLESGKVKPEEIYQKVR